MAADLRVLGDELYRGWSECEAPTPRREMWAGLMAGLRLGLVAFDLVSPVSGAQRPG